MTQEKWVEIDLNGRPYKVSNTGRVMSVTRILRQRDGRSRVLYGKELSLYVRKSDGRKSMVVGRKSFPLHRIVASAFLGPLPKGKVTSHKDGNCLNNNVDNLEYITQEENLRNSADKPCRLNKSGTRGVCHVTHKGQTWWVGSMGYKHTRHAVWFKTKMEAVAWRKIMELLYKTDRRSA